MHDRPSSNSICCPLAAQSCTQNAHQQLAKTWLIQSWGPTDCTHLILNKDMCVLTESQHVILLLLSSSSAFCILSVSFVFFFLVHWRLAGHKYSCPPLSCKTAWWQGELRDHSEPEAGDDAMRWLRRYSSWFPLQLSNTAWHGRSSLLISMLRVENHMSEACCPAINYAARRSNAHNCSSVTAKSGLATGRSFGLYVPQPRGWNMGVESRQSSSCCAREACWSEEAQRRLHTFRDTSVCRDTSFLQRQREKHSFYFILKVFLHKKSKFPQKRKALRVRCTRLSCARLADHKQHCSSVSCKVAQSQWGLSFPGSPLQSSNFARHWWPPPLPSRIYGLVIRA